MTDKEAWVRFASGALARPDVPSDQAAALADDALREMHERFPEEPKAKAAVTKEEIHEWIYQQHGSVPSWFCSKCGIQLNASSSANPPATHPHYPCTKGGSHG